MLIRKSYEFVGNHIVRDCSSERCKKSIHGHKYLVEVFLTSNKLDNGQMVTDFGLLKGNIKDLINSFHNSYSMWSKEKEDFKSFIYEKETRIVEMPVSPSAEMYSLMFFYLLDKLVQNTQFNNGEGEVQLHSVRVHETRTGYAESFREDLKWWNYDLEDIKFSPDVISKWNNPLMIDQIQAGIPFSNPIVDLYYQD